VVDKQLRMDRTEHSCTGTGSVLSIFFFITTAHWLFYTPPPDSHIHLHPDQANGCWATVGRPYPSGLAFVGTQPAIKLLRGTVRILPARATVKLQAVCSVLIARAVRALSSRPPAML
jgi:hypothetical protein